jgi:hypothetical protein
MKWVPLGLFVIAASIAPVCALGEVFVLNNGGRIEGTLQNPKEAPREKYVIKTAAGGEVELAKDQVKEVIRQNPRELEYEKIKPNYPDTVEGQWALAEWCREQKLTEARKRHLLRVIELDPDHKAARAALNHRYVDGRWKTVDQIWQDKGYVKDSKGLWKLPQEIEEQTRRDAQDRVEKEWFKKIKRWRDWLPGERTNEAQQEFARITDPNAVPALKKNLENEPLEAVRKLYVQALARIASPAALQILAASSMGDISDEIRLTCLDFLAKDPQPSAIDFYVKQLRSKDNILVNRAAVGLGRLNATSALRPLVDALVTTHQFKIVTGQEGQMSTTFGSNGGIGFGAGGGGPKIITKQIANSDVRDALVKLSGGVDFEYDVRAWRNWLSTQKKPPQKIVGRRD